MTAKSIKNPEAFLVSHPNSPASYGCDQEWYQNEWQRTAGCGPSVVSNILFYMGYTGPSAGTLTKDACLSMMEAAWEHVTPTMQGVSSARQLREGVEKYAAAKGWALELEELHIPALKRRRPPFALINEFISAALETDTPIAFLNLHNGQEKNLYPWHWVTLVALEWDEETGEAAASIVDDGKLMRIDLSRWVRTSRLGGGFVRFQKRG